MRYITMSNADIGILTLILVFGYFLVAMTIYGNVYGSVEGNKVMWVKVLFWPIVLVAYLIRLLVVDLPVVIYHVLKGK